MQPIILKDIQISTPRNPLKLLFTTKMHTDRNFRGQISLNLVRLYTSPASIAAASTCYLYLQKLTSN